MSGARTLQRGLEVLLAIRDADRELSVTDIARSTGLDRAVIARLLPPLVDAGFIVADGTPPRYVVGAGLGVVDPGEVPPRPVVEPPASLGVVEDGTWDLTWTGFGSGWDEVDMIAEQEESGRSFMDATIDDAFAALMSLVGGMPLAEIADRVFGGAIPSSFLEMMGRVGLEDLGPDYATIIGRMRDIDPVAAFRMFFAGRSERDRDILRDRLTVEPETLEALAVRHDISRERVRQIVRDARKEFEAALVSHTLIIERTALARSSIGSVVDMRQLRRTLRAAVPMVVHLALEVDEVFFFLLFPEGSFARYGEKSPWFVDEDTRRRVTDVRARALTDGVATEALLEEVPALRAVDELPAFLAAIGLQELDGEVVQRNLSMSERTVRLLRRTGAPINFDDIVEVLESGDRARSLRNALLADGRIVRVDKDTFALAEWELAAYSTVRDLMRQEIEASGGEASVADIKQRLTAQFDIKASSIDTYANSPEFVRVTPGVIRLRADDEPMGDVERPLHSLRGCVRTGRRWALRVEVTASLLKGFSVLLPTGMARHFGVARGESVTLSTDLSGDISIVRRGLQDNIGRLRWVAEELGLVEGDVLFVRLPERGGGRISFSGLARSDLERANIRRRAGLLLGQDADLTVNLASSALDMPRGSRPGDIADRLRSRGEDELAALVGEALGEGTVTDVDASDIARMLGLG